jgi:hypothetical protein
MSSKGGEKRPLPQKKEPQKHSFEAGEGRTLKALA